MSRVVRGMEVGSEEWHLYLGTLWGAERKAVLKEAGIWKEPPPAPPKSADHYEFIYDPAPAPFPDEGAFCSDGAWDGMPQKRVGVFDSRHFWHVPAPTTLGVSRPDTTTNARVKRYLAKDILQVSNYEIFPTGDWERTDGRPKRQLREKDPLDDSEPEVKDPERSLFESKRRAKSKVRDIALCNRFTHMFTWTLDQELVDRYDPEAVYKKVRAFLSNATQRKDFRYVCIPEHHKLRFGEVRPGIHMHGLCTLGDVQITPSIRKNGTLRKDTSGRQVYNMGDWRWGFSTCVALDEDYEKAVNYVCKYITKCDEKIFGKWYLSSRVLTKAPEIIPLEPMDYESFRDPLKLEARDQMETEIFGSVKILSEEYKRE